MSLSLSSSPEVSTSLSINQISETQKLSNFQIPLLFFFSNITKNAKTHCTCKIHFTFSLIWSFKNSKMQQSDINASNCQYYQPPHSHFQNPNPNPSFDHNLNPMPYTYASAPPIPYSDADFSSAYPPYPLNPQSYDPSSYIHNFDPNPSFSDNSNSSIRKQFCTIDAELWWGFGWWWWSLCLWWW